MAELLQADGRQVRVSTLLQIADLEVLTGRLVSSAGLEIGFHQGEIVRARLGALVGVVAAQEGFLIAHERLSLESREEPAAHPIAPVLALIVEGCRLADDWGRLSTKVLVARGETPSDLPTDAVRLLRALDGRRPVGAVAERHGLTRSLLVDPLLGLLESGALVEAVAPVVDDDAFDDLLARARSQVRSGGYDQARTTFEAALSLRPGDPTVRQNLRRLDQLRGGRFP